MQHIARVEPPPAILIGAPAQLQRTNFYKFMNSGHEKVSQSKGYLSSLNLSDPSMQRALQKVFSGRCAFCEAAGVMVAYRFRPSTEALPYQRSEFAHTYYNWLDIAWQNIYAICKSCTPREPNHFPVIGKRSELPSIEQYKQYAETETEIGLWPSYPPKEKPVLLDPCIDRNFYFHLDVRTDGKLLGLTERGRVTIDHFQLNAPSRIIERATCYQDYFQQLVAWIGSSTRSAPTPFFNFPTLEFGGTWYILLRQIAASLGARISLRPILSMKRIDRVFRQLRGTPDAQKRLDQCWQRTIDTPSETKATPEKKDPRTSETTITSIAIKNFKSLENLHIELNDNRLSPMDTAIRRTRSLLIIGENATGKSSVLEAIALTLASASTRQKLGLTANNFILDPRFLGAKVPPDINKATVEILLSDGSRRTLHIEPGEMYNAPTSASGSLPVFAYGAFRQYQHKRRRTTSPETFIRNLFDGSVLLNPEKWLLELSADRFVMVIRALREILSINGTFEVIRRDAEERQCFVVTSTMADGSPLNQNPLNVASSGFRSVLAMACDVMRGMMDPKVNPGFESLETTKGVVLIDEVEAHLHPRWKMRIMSGLRSALPGVTFIATTHDPLCLRGMSEGEIVVLRRVEVSTGTTSAGLQVQVEAQTDLPTTSELRVEQLLTSDLFQLHSTDDPEMDRQLAHIGDLLAREVNTLTDEERRIVERFNQDIASALPIGTSEAHRLVQEAVADFLNQRKQTASNLLVKIRKDAKMRIVKALQGGV